MRTLATRHALGALAVAAAGAAAPAGAQQPAPAGAGPAPAAPCTYDTCALRRERVFFSERLLAGTRGAVAVRQRAFGAFPLDSIVRGVPEAEADARAYRRAQVAGQVLTIVGSLLTAAAVVDAVANSDGGTCGAALIAGACSNNGWRGRNTALLVGGTVFSVGGGVRLQAADRSLNRALFWYNRSLPR